VRFRALLVVVGLTSLATGFLRSAAAPAKDAPNRAITTSTSSIRDVPTTGAVPSTAAPPSATTTASENDEDDDRDDEHDEVEAGDDFDEEE